MSSEKTANFTGIPGKIEYTGNPGILQLDFAGNPGKMMIK